MFRVTFLLALPCLITAAVVSSPETGNENFRTARKEEPSKWKAASKLIEGCLSQEYSEMANCFGVKAVAFIDRASRMHTINLLPGVTFVADNEELQRSGRALMTEEEIENSISSEPNEKGSKLADMLFDSITRFMQSHVLQFRLPKSTSFEMERALDEGRAKLKKKLLPYVGLLAVKLFALLPLFLGAVGFFALKALFIGKIALIVAAVLALQKFSPYGGFGGFGKLTDGFGVSGPSYSPSLSSPGGYYRRSIEDQAAAHHLAYNAQTPHEASTSS